jgi:outer membrane protein assembly factor BamB
MAYGLTDGRRLWVRPADKLCQISKMAASGSTVLFDQFCDGKFLVAVDATTGKLRWSTEFPEQSMLMEILSAEPAVVDLADATLEHAVVSYDAKGRKQAQIPKNVGGFDLDLSRMGFARDGQPRLPLAVVGTTLYLKTNSLRGGDSYQNQVVAVDVTTGKLRWSSSGHSESRFHLIRAEADHLVGFEEGGFRTPPRLVRIAADTGKVSTVAEATVDDDFRLPFEPDLREKDGTLVVLSLSRSTSGHAVMTLR